MPRDSFLVITPKGVELLEVLEGQSPTSISGRAMLAILDLLAIEDDAGIKDLEKVVSGATGLSGLVLQQTVVENTNKLTREGFTANILGRGKSGLEERVFQSRNRPTRKIRPELGVERFPELEPRSGGSLN